MFLMDKTARKVFKNKTVVLLAVVFALKNGRTDWVHICMTKNYHFF
jgi:hypothetical protein